MYTTLLFSLLNGVSKYCIVFFILTLPLPSKIYILLPWSDIENTISVYSASLYCTNCNFTFTMLNVF